MKITEDIKIKDGTGLVIFINGILFLMVYATIKEFRIGFFEPILGIATFFAFSFFTYVKIRKLPSTLPSLTAAESDRDSGALLNIDMKHFVNNPYPSSED